MIQVLKNRKTAFATVEALMALVIFSVVLTSVCQLVGWHAQQRRESFRRLIALEEISNLMERTCARQWADITSSSLEATELSSSVHESLPAARLSIQVDETDEEMAAKRIQLELSWSNVPSAPRPNVRLVVWKYGEESSSP